VWERGNGEDVCVRKWECVMYGMGNEEDGKAQLQL